MVYCTIQYTPYTLGNRVKHTVHYHIMVRYVQMDDGGICSATLFLRHEHNMSHCTYSTHTWYGIVLSITTVTLQQNRHIVK